MNLTDYLVILAVIASAVVGAWRGLLREAVALAAWVIALFLAWHFSDLIAPHLGGLMSDSGVRPWAARVIIVLLRLQEEQWWRHSMLIPYGESMANGLRMLVGEERVRRAAAELRIRV